MKRMRYCIVVGLDRALCWTGHRPYRLFNRLSIWSSNLNDRWDLDYWKKVD